MWPFPKPPVSKDSRSSASPLSTSDCIQGVDLDVSELIALRYQVGALSVRRQKRALSVLTGSSGSPFKGRGIDFEEVRRYQAGDESRHMDWRVTARAGNPYLKLFREERERPVFFVVDFSSSMFFGTRVAFKIGHCRPRRNPLGLDLPEAWGPGRFLDFFRSRTCRVTSTRGPFGRSPLCPIFGQYAPASQRR